LVTRVPRFGSSEKLYAHVIMVVGHHGVDDEFDVRVERLGPTSLRISIAKTLEAGSKAAPRNIPRRYTRVGQRQTDGDAIGYATLPTGGTGGL
jgi:hypothetical protein